MTYYDAIDKYFNLGAHLKQRDSKSVRRIVSGFIKLLHPDGLYTKDDVREYLVTAMEMRRRVKEQLKRNTYNLAKLELTNKSIFDLSLDNFKVTGYESSPVLKGKLSN